MCETRKQIKCPHCRNAKVVRNGKKANGQQNYWCKNCGKQFQDQYFYNACNPEIRELIRRMLLRGNGIGDICSVLSVSAKAVLRLLVSWGKRIQVKPRQKRYFKVQIDEMWSFVGSKQRKYGFCTLTAPNPRRYSL